MTSSPPALPGYDPNAAVKVTFAPLNEQQLPQCFAVDELVGGSFKANREQLEELCDKIFGSDRNWVLHSDELEVDWGRTTALQQAVPLQQAEPEAKAASVSLNAMVCSFVCVRIVVAPPDAPKSPRTVITHLFVDHGWAMTFGRELFGFPALFAVFEKAGDTLQIKLDSSQSGQRELALTLRLNEASSTPPAASSFWGKVSRNPDDSDLRTIPFVQSKQIRDGIQAKRACYRTLVEGEVRIEMAAPRVKGAGLTLILPAEGLLTDADLGLASPATSSTGYATQALKLNVKVQSPQQEPVLRNGRRGPPLRERRGDLQAAPPYLFTDVDIVGFRLPVRQDLLQKLCDTWLNAPFKGRSYKYRPANVDLVVECLHYPSMQSANPPFGFKPEAITSQRELVFRILVGRVDDDGRAIRSPAVFCPFVFVDNTQSLISGREVIGYPKLLAGFKPIGAAGAPFDACQIDAVTPNPSTRVTDVPLLTIDCRFERTPRDVKLLFEQPLPKTASERNTLGPTPVGYAWWGLGDLQSGGANPETFIEPWLNGQTYGYAGLQAKRFSDARKVRRECYHELVECDYTLLKAVVSQPLHDATLFFPEEDVYGIAKAFGFAPTVPVPPGSWYRTKADFAFNVVDPLA